MPDDKPRFVVVNRNRTRDENHHPGDVAEVYELSEPIPAPTYPGLLTDVAWDELIPSGTQVKTAAEIRADSAATVRRVQEIDRSAAVVPFPLPVVEPQRPMADTQRRPTSTQQPRAPEQIHRPEQQERRTDHHVPPGHGSNVAAEPHTHTGKGTR